MLHNFNKSLNHEREFAERADRFYRKQMNATEILRYNTDSERDMAVQHHDIDITLTINGKNYNVSEKFRDIDFGDLYVEIYSKYPHTFGWIHTGNPDFIAYFTPNSVYLISHRDLRNFCLNTLFPAIPQTYFQEIFETGKTLLKKQITLNEKPVQITIIQAHNKTGNTVWKTIGTAIEFDILKKFEVKVRKY